MKCGECEFFIKMYHPKFDDEDEVSNLDYDGHCYHGDVSVLEDEVSSDKEAPDWCPLKKDQ